MLDVGTVLDSLRLDVWDCLRQFEFEITGLFLDSPVLKLGLFSNNPELKFRDCVGPSRDRSCTKIGPCVLFVCYF